MGTSAVHNQIVTKLSARTSPPGLSLAAVEGAEETLLGTCRKIIDSLLHSAKASSKYYRQVATIE
jgi:hypothetical protein